MNRRKSKKLFYKNSSKWILKEGYATVYINPYIVKQVVKKLERYTKLNLTYYLHNRVEKDCFVIRTLHKCNELK